MPDPTFNVADTNDATLENFLSRPIKTRSYNWATNATIFESFNPWQDFFENPRVLNRISNFNLLRCKLKMRIMLNGNGFHYGRAIASYVPLHSYDNFTKDRAFFIQDVVAASQRPHVYLDPTNSQGGTITLPFVWHNNALSIPDQAWRFMGETTIHGMQPLKHANGAVDDVTVSVFVWAEEVSLSIPTSNVPDALVPQMGEIFDPQVDEYATGPISRPAGVVARVAGALSKVPGISAYARATEMAASAVSSIAVMFGFSRPIIIQDIMPYKPSYLSNLANTNVGDNSQKLSLDVKQELSIDPRIMGLGSTDEMSIKSIAQRESYITQFAWPVDAPTESLLWATEVTPVTWAQITGISSEFHMPACCFATLPFKHWRGTIKYRFQVVASAYHKGRLKLSYDPSYPLTNEYNTNYTHIIDLAKERDFTMSVGWGSDKAMCTRPNMVNSLVPYRTTPFSAPPGDRSNGILSVYVVNDLTVPNSIVDNDISINVFVSAGDDFEVFNPDSEVLDDISWFQPQMGEIFDSQMGEAEDHPESTLTVDENAPMKTDSNNQIAPTLDDADHTMSAYFGDPVTSFRQCLKRYNWHSVIAPQSVGLRDYSFILGDFPFYRGYAPGGVHKTSSNVPYNYCKMTLLNYVTPAYTCARGGLRWKYLRTGGQTTETSLMQVSRTGYVETGATEISESVLTIAGGSQDKRARQTLFNMPHIWDGATSTSTRQNPVVEVELPYFSDERFFPAKWSGKTAISRFNTYHTLHTTWDNNGSDAPRIHCYSSTAEDFTLGFFTGAPVAYRVNKGADPLAL